MRQWQILAAAVAVTALAACGEGEGDFGPGGVTVSEARALDEAAAMLDARRDAAAVPPVAASPSATATGSPTTPD